MNRNNWKNVWEKRKADIDILKGEDEKKIILELKRCNGFDVIGDGLTYESILQQFQLIKKNLSVKTAGCAESIASVYEVGGGSGANLFLFEKEGMRCGMVDYSQSLVEIAKMVLQSRDIRCDEAVNINVEPRYDSILANSVFSYFTDEAYALQALEKMYLKAEKSIGIVDIHDKDKELEFLKYRKETVEDYEKRYEGLPKLFYSHDFFADFAKKYDMDIKFEKSDIAGYWNNRFVFNCYFYKW